MTSDAAVRLGVHLGHLSSEYSRSCNGGRDDLIFFFFKSARNVFNEEEVNYDNYSEWSDP